jgi:hypothetical protein
MKLSEAIRLGAMLRPQGTDVFFAFGKSCALGAASEAIGLQQPRFQPYADIVAAFPILAEGSHECPDCGEVKGELGYLVTHLNDIHRWTRECIADRVAAIEDAEAAKAESPVAAEVTA